MKKRGIERVLSSTSTSSVDWIGETDGFEKKGLGKTLIGGGGSCSEC